MSLKISPLEVGYIPHGIFKGAPCVRLFTDDQGEDKSVNEILGRVFQLMTAEGSLGSTEIRYSNGKNVCVQGRLSVYPELREIIAGLSSKGKTVFFITPADENIEPLRMVKNVNFIVDMDVPTSSQNKVNPKLFPLLKETDEVIITVSSLEDYQTVKQYFKGRTVTRPSVSFNIRTMDNETVPKFKEALFFDLKDYHFPVRVTR